MKSTLLPAQDTIIHRQISKNSEYEILNIRFEQDTFTELQPGIFCCASPTSADVILSKYNEIPPFLRGNPYVHNGYRVYLSGAKCVKSMFQWNNETVNIWSHFLGFVTFFLLTILDNFVLIPHYKGSLSDHIAVSIGLICYQFCMLCSAGYHIFVCHSERACRRWLSIDLAGICVGLIGCYVPAVHFAFYCLSIWRDVYLILVTVLSLCVLGVQLHPRYFSTEMWRFRMAVYLGLAGFGVVPTAHWVYLNGGFESVLVQLFFYKVVTIYFIGVVGFLFYATKFPECLFPGKVDYIGSSHQWWHLVVVIAFLYWHYAGSVLLYYRTHTACIH